MKSLSICGLKKIKIRSRKSQDENVGASRMKKLKSPVKV
jgi:hypothetical protein